MLKNDKGISTGVPCVARKAKHGGSGGNRLLRRIRPGRSYAGPPTLADADLLSAIQPQAALAEISRLFTPEVTFCK